MPHLVRKSLERRRGRPKLPQRKQQVALRIDPDILEHFRARGRGLAAAIKDARTSIVTHMVNAF